MRFADRAFASLGRLPAMIAKRPIPVEPADPEVTATLEETISSPGGRDLTYLSADGLRLHVAEYGDPISPWLPVVCIPGLSRNARDFHDLAIHLGVATPF